MPVKEEEEEDIKCLFPKLVIPIKIQKQYSLWPKQCYLKLPPTQLLLYTFNNLTSTLQVILLHFWHLWCSVSIKRAISATKKS